MNLEEQLLGLDVAESRPEWRYLAQGQLAHLVSPGSNKALCGLRANSWKDWLGDIDPTPVASRRNCARCTRKEVEL